MAQPLQPQVATPLYSFYLKSTFVLLTLRFSVLTNFGYSNPNPTVICQSTPAYWMDCQRSLWKITKNCQSEVSPKCISSSIFDGACLHQLNGLLREVCERLKKIANMRSRAPKCIWCPCDQTQATIPRRQCMVLQIYVKIWMTMMYGSNVKIP